MYTLDTITHLKIMSSSNNENVYISIFSPEDKYGLRNVEIFKTRPYQKEAYHHFMKSEKDKESYHFPDGIKFDIIKFDTSNLQGEYPTFCTMVTEDKRIQFLSSNKEHLTDFFQDSF